MTAAMFLCDEMLQLFTKHCQLLTLVPTELSQGTRQTSKSPFLVEETKWLPSLESSRLIAQLQKPMLQHLLQDPLEAVVVVVHGTSIHPQTLQRIQKRALLHHLQSGGEYLAEELVHSQMMTSQSRCSSNQWRFRKILQTSSTSLRTAFPIGMHQTGLTRMPTFVGKQKKQQMQRKRKQRLLHSLHLFQQTTMTRNIRLCIERFLLSILNLLLLLLTPLRVQGRGKGSRETPTG